MDLLDDPQYTVPCVPCASSGIAWLRSHVARFSEGTEHARRRGLADALLQAAPPERLRRPGHPVATLADALGLPRHVAAEVEIVARAYQPHEAITPEADAAVERLVATVGGAHDERTAAVIGVLVQACAATRAALAGHEPPVASTRRVTPSGDEVRIDLQDAPFGAGRHACPGSRHAQALLAGARHFADLHAQDEPLLLPNAWDIGSAVALVRSGHQAIGTTSMGVATAHGLPDAVGAAASETLALARALAPLPVPVTVDVEAGLGADLADLAAELSMLGIAGINLEDGRGDRLVPVAEMTARISLIKGTVPELFVNARTDTHWLGVEQATMLERATAYAEAGADGVFVPGLRDEAAVERVVAALGPTPLNLLAQLPYARLRDLGVRRISTGSLLYRTAMTQACSAVDAYRDGQPLPAALPYDAPQWQPWPRASRTVPVRPGVVPSGATAG